MDIFRRFVVLRGLEAGDGFISGLVATNPVNATDQVAQGDDHLRLIKTAVKGTFPNLTGAVTASQAELNILDGATLSTAELNILDGVTLTAAQINDAARKTVQNTFTQNQIISGTGVQLGVHDGAREVRLRSDGSVGTVTNDSFSIITFDTIQMTVNGSGNFDFKSGTVTTDKAGANEVGTLGVPRVSKIADYTIAAVDSGTELVLTSAADDITVQASGAPAAGCVVFLENGTGGAVDIVQGSGMTLTLDGTATTGSRTLAANGRAYVRFTSSSTASVGGLGVA